MANLNQCNFIGHVGLDPETRSFPDGGQITTCSIACTSRWNDRETRRQHERTEWVRLSFRGRLAEIVSQYVRKGSLIYASGELVTSKFQGQDGQDRYITEVRVREMQMLGGKQTGTGPAPAPYQAEPAATPAAAAPAGSFGAGDDDMDSDSPF